MRVRPTHAAALIVLILSFAAQAQADSVLLGTGGTPLQGVLAFGPNGPLAQSFTLTTTINVSAINIFVSGGSSGPLLIQLVNMIGLGTTTSNVLAQGSVSPSGATEWLSIATATTLGPGTYFLVVSSATPNNSGWIRTAGNLPSTVGTVGTTFFTNASNVDLAFAPASNWLGNGVTNVGFEIVGNTNPVPEPGTLALMGSGLAGIWLRRRRKA